MENAMLDPFLFAPNSDKLVGKLADLKIEFWDALLDEIGGGRIAGRPVDFLESVNSTHSA